MRRIACEGHPIGSGKERGCCYVQSSTSRVEGCRPQSVRRLCGTATHTAYRTILGRLRHRLYALPHGGHDHHHRRAALLRQLLSCRRIVRGAGHCLGRREPHTGQAGRQVRSAPGVDSHHHRVGDRRDRVDHQHSIPCAGMGVVLHHAVHGGHSAVGCDEPPALDEPAQRRYREDEPRAFAVWRVRRMHVGDRQSARLDAGCDLRPAGVLVHRHVRDRRRVDVPDRAVHRTEIADAAGSRGRTDPQAVPRARSRACRGPAG